MTIIVPQDDLIAALETQWAALDSLASSLDDEQWSGPSILPGWQIRDVIAHVAGTEAMLAGLQPSSTIDAAAVPHVRNPIGELNERWVDHYRRLSREQVMADYRRITDDRATYLRGLTEGQWEAETATPAGPDSYGRFMRIRDFDCWVHEVDLRDSLGIDGPVAPAPAAWALDEVATALPFIVGKKAGTPEGAAVRFEVTGLAARTVDIAVTGRASVVPALDRDPDVSLTLDTLDLVRLCGGRSTADPSRVAVAGDTAVGDAIVANLHYMI
ncbi:maleylpyruvate isomerase family mycothiol-dependent enzyme [Gordonia shandongensis]|uniref:maleylpyruvate isomerase family mycothiol-dependent enzyme n=1 Tax=Gordonia shandongensis TaxID=376351 RepID=UPI00041E07E1|nr:maleylpyruvate isomerase family mycothiol-dependent enzyme [Gordonia shandongensis]